MTKAQLKQKYTEWNINIGKLEEKKYEIFHELQELCAEKGDGHKWCSLQKLVEELVKTGNASKALDLMEKYCKIEGQSEALRNLATATNNFDI